MSSLFAAAGTLAVVAGRAASPPVLPLAQSGDGGMMLLLCCYGLVLLGYLALVYWVYQDAAARGNDKAGLWALLVFFTPVIGLLIYWLVGRAQGTRALSGPPPVPPRRNDSDTRHF